MDKLNRYSTRISHCAIGLLKPSKRPERNSLIVTDFAGGSESVPEFESREDDFVDKSESENNNIYKGEPLTLPSHPLNRRCLEALFRRKCQEGFSVSDKSEEPTVTPERSEVMNQFKDYMELLMPMTEEEEKELRMLTVEEKWKIIFNLQVRPPICSAGHYVDSINKYLDPERRMRTISKMSGKELDNPNQISNVLKKLKLDLKMSYDSFQHEFLDPPNNGVTLLIQLLRDIHSEQQAKQVNQQKRARHDQHKRSLTDENDALICIKFAAEREAGMQCLLSVPSGLDTIAQCLMSSFSKTRIVALEIMTSCCHSSAGYQKVMDAISYLRLYNGESVRFKFLVGMLQTQGAAFIHFQGACVKFFNAILHNEANMNSKIYIQHELMLAGFEPEQLEKHAYGEGDEFDDLQRELVIWKGNYVDVQILLSHANDLEGRNFLLRQEVDLLQGRIKGFEKTKKAQEKQIIEINERCDEYQERIASLQDTVQSLTFLYKANTGKEAQNEVKSLDSVLKPLEDTPLDDNQDKYATIRSITSIVSLEPPPPPPIMDTTPPSPAKKIMVPKVNLPMLNWTPISEVKNTIFLNADAEEIYQRVDLADFEKKFELKSAHESRSSRERRERAIRRLQTQIRFIELSRARNMIITKRRIGLSPDEVEEAVNQCDVTRIPGEYAEMLLKFLPSKDEVRLLTQHANEYTEMAEAEQFMFHLAQIDRLESKLSVMAFMAIFDDLTQDLIPQLETIHRASQSVTYSLRMKKIFEIILAVGNYMNGGRRGYSNGFKLESLYKLQDVKSNDKSITLLQYLVEIIALKYPELGEFYEDLDIDIGRAASLQGLLADVHALRRGLALVKIEKGKLSNPRSLEVFYKRASSEVPRVADLHKRMEDCYREACLKYGENYKNIEPDAFFRVFQDFVANYKRAEEECSRRQFVNKQMTSQYNGPNFATLPRAVRTNPCHTLPRSKNISVKPTDTTAVVKPVDTTAVVKPADTTAVVAPEFVSSKSISLGKGSDTPRVRQIMNSGTGRSEETSHSSLNGVATTGFHSSGLITPPPDYTDLISPEQDSYDVIASPPADKLEEALADFDVQVNRYFPDDSHNNLLTEINMASDEEVTFL